MRNFISKSFFRQKERKNQLGQAALAVVLGVLALLLTVKFIGVPYLQAELSTEMTKTKAYPDADPLPVPTPPTNSAALSIPSSTMVFESSSVIFWPNQIKKVSFSNSEKSRFSIYSSDSFFSGGQNTKSSANSTAKSPTKHAAQPPTKSTAKSVTSPDKSKDKAIKTPAEKNNYQSYSQYEEITLFLAQLKNISPHLHIETIGRTLEQENYPARDLYLCLLTEEGFSRPEELAQQSPPRPTIMIIASQHGNEQSAKEATLRLLRDVAVGELRPLLKKVNFLIIPQANPYGNFFNQRRNEQGLDLNRDHVKLEAPEVEAIHRVFRRWMPEVSIDVHEKGDDYYRVSIGCVSNPNIDARLQEFSRQVVLAEVSRDLAQKKITFHEYLVTQPMGIDSSAGVNYPPSDVSRRETMKRYSTTDLNDGRNSLGIYQTLSFIQEGASRHDLKTLRERTEWQYYGLRFFSESIARHAQEILKLVKEARSQVLARAKTYSHDDLIHLRMKYARDPKQPTLTIKQFVRSRSPIRFILKVNKRAGDPVTIEEIEPYDYPAEYKVEEVVVKNWFPLVEPLVSVSRPLGYVIPQARFDVVETLIRHRLKVYVFEESGVLSVEAYQVKEVIPAEYDYLPPQKIEVEKRELEIPVKRGDFYIPCDQVGANLIPCLLEPQSQYGFIRYWKYKLVPEAGDIFPIYRTTQKTTLSLIPFKDWEEGRGRAAPSY